jgi:hypothetical protein
LNIWRVRRKGKILRPRDSWAVKEKAWVNEKRPLLKQAEQQRKTFGWREKERRNMDSVRGPQILDGWMQIWQRVHKSTSWGFSSVTKCGPGRTGENIKQAKEIDCVRYTRTASTPWRQQPTLPVSCHPVRITAA